ncbi:hypothetical protein GE061_000334 [Apolygus lucorum]|uniref:FHF complex subunit HOOK-interacting protein C-terminal domain-containing protein n=1 Tax=Apolygus lucorum TaxID=248454 RepID=A0A6A4KDW1_APOLU|nr:hypothetical protein GE061_000334 [Apolygus lucorum]
MSWLRNSPFQSSLGKLLPLSSPTKDFDPTACFDSFRKHWQQINDIIRDTLGGSVPMKNDDILAVFYNLDHMTTLLLLELSSHSKLTCLEYLLSENILDKLYSWSLQTGKFETAFRCELLKLYEVLLSCSNSQSFIHYNVCHSLLKLLNSCLDKCFSVDVEKRLVVLLSSLCVGFLNNSRLLDLFFDNKDSENPKFIVFSLLIPFVHREGTLGQQARDALLHCMKISKMNLNIAEFIAIHSDICPYLATGLSGLYSLLPRTLDIEAQDWHRLTPDDINDLPELAIFMNSLEFCNAAIEIAHPLVVSSLLEYIYQGFLVQVMGPALLQSALNELTTATAYFDMIMRSLTAPGLLYSFIKFILVEDLDGQCIIDIFIERINGNQKLCLVTLALMETLIGLNCEDVMLELVFKHLMSCNHIMASQRSKINYCDPHSKNAETFLQLIPNIQRSKQCEGSLYGDYHAYLMDARSKIEVCGLATSVWVYSYNGENPTYSGTKVSMENVSDHPSLPSADDVSSGYESFAKPGEIVSEYGSGGEFDSPSSESETSNDGRNANPALQNFPSSPCIGPFLQALFNKLENMLAQNLFINLHLTGLISRLAIYSQPLLTSFLLDHSLIFQPSVRSLFQILSSLKQSIESKTSECSPSQLSNIVLESEAILIDRENKLVNLRKYALQILSNSSSCADEKPWSGGNLLDRENRKKGFSLNLNNVFSRQNINNTNPNRSEQKVEDVKTNFRLPANVDGIHNTIMCAIILSEWLKELAAISQEHTVFRQSHEFEDT